MHDIDNLLQISYENRIASQTEEAKNPIFLKQFAEVYPDFIQRILYKHPQLSKSELTLIAMIFLNFSSKEIAEYTFIQHRSVLTNKSRLRKKMQLSSYMDLYRYIKSFYLILFCNRFIWLCPLSSVFSWSYAEILLRIIYPRNHSLYTHLRRVYIFTPCKGSRSFLSAVDKYQCGIITGSNSSRCLSTSTRAENRLLEQGQSRHLYCRDHLRGVSRLCTRCDLKTKFWNVVDILTFINLFIYFCRLVRLITHMVW